jgi:hypothetical protein
MIRLRYLLVAVIVLALAPWALDSLPSLSCVIPTIDCLDESHATVSNEDAPRSTGASNAVLPEPPRTQPDDDVASVPAAGNTARAISMPDAPAAAARDGTPAARDNSFSFTATPGFGGVVTIKWHVPDETGVEHYLLDRKLKSDSDDAFERHITLQRADGSMEYSWTDTPPSDTYTYRLRALASTDSSDAGKTLGTADVAVEYVVGLAVGDFALGAASGLVSVNWTAAHEGGVVSYVLDRKLEGAAAYVLNVEVGYPQGDGTVYSLFDDPHGTGTFIYRLRATLTNGTDRILAEAGVVL